MWADNNNPNDSEFESLIYVTSNVSFRVTHSFYVVAIGVKDKGTIVIWVINLS